MLGLQQNIPWLSAWHKWKVSLTSNNPDNMVIYCINYWQLLHMWWKRFIGTVWRKSVNFILIKPLIIKYCKLLCRLFKIINSYEPNHFFSNYMSLVNNLKENDWVTKVTDSLSYFIALDPNLVGSLGSVITSLPTDQEVTAQLWTFL